MTTAPTDLTKIMDALNMEGFSVEEQEELLLDLNELVFKGTMVRLIERMDDETRIAFNELMDSDASEEEVEAFLHAHVPDADAAVQETIQDISSDILAVTK